MVSWKDLTTPILKTFAKIHLSLKNFFLPEWKEYRRRARKGVYSAKMEYIEKNTSRKQFLAFLYAGKPVTIDGVTYRLKQ